MMRSSGFNMMRSSGVQSAGGPGAGPTGAEHLVSGKSQAVCDEGSPGLLTVSVLPPSSPWDYPILDSNNRGSTDHLRRGSFAEGSSRQSDGSIVIEGVYMDTSHSGTPQCNCQQRQIAEFRASVRAKSAAKMPPTSRDAGEQKCSNVWFDSFRMEDDLSQAETSRTAVSLQLQFTTETETASGDANDEEDTLACDGIHIAGLEDEDEDDEYDEYDEIDEFVDFDDINQLPAASQSADGCSGTTSQHQTRISTHSPRDTLSPAAARAQEECLGTSQALLDAKFALACEPLEYQ